MLSSSKNALLKLPKTTPLKKLLGYDYMTLFWKRNGGKRHYFKSIPSSPKKGGESQLIRAIPLDPPLITVQKMSCSLPSTVT